MGIDTDKRNALIAKGAALLLVALIIAVAIAYYSSVGQTSAEPGPYDGQHDKDPYNLGFSIENGKGTTRVDTAYKNESARTVTICGSDYNDIYFSKEPPTADELEAAVDKDPYIPSIYKDDLYWFINRLFEMYPDIDLRIFELGLRNLEIEMVSKEKLAEISRSSSTCGCYKKSENKIYLEKGYYGLLDQKRYQVLIHELVHAVREAELYENGWEVRAQTALDRTEFLMEAFTQIIAMQMLELPQDSEYYTLQCNMVWVMLECVDDYELEDYFKQGTSYFALKLDQPCHDTNYAMTMLKVMDVMCKDCENGPSSRPKEAYAPLYDYLTRLYLNKYGWNGMSSEDVQALTKKLVDRVTLHAPSRYDIDVGEFYRYAADYSARHFGTS